MSSPRPQIFLATANAHKLQEFQLLARRDQLAVDFRSARELGGMPPVAEDTGTFLGNARQKAQALRKLLSAPAWVVADDSGLCVDALAGAPGVESAHFAGPKAESRDNLEKLLRVLVGVEEGRRQAHFYCLLLVLDPAGREYCFEGKCYGQILRAPRGTGGFGYDPVFALETTGQALAELPAEEKNQCSHRALAWRELVQFLRQQAAP